MLTIIHKNTTIFIEKPTDQQPSTEDKQDRHLLTNCDIVKSNSIEITVCFA